MNTIKKYAIPFTLLLVCCLLLIATFIPYYSEELEEQDRINSTYNQKISKLEAEVDDYESQYSSLERKKLILSKSEFAKCEAKMQRLNRLIELNNEQAEAYHDMYVIPSLQQFSKLCEARRTLQTIFGIASAIVFVGGVVSTIMIYKKNKDLNIDEIQDSEE